MAKAQVLSLIRKYLATLPEFGFRPEKAVLFGSYARGEANKWSDIDLVVVSPEFDRPHKRELIHQLWYAALETDLRIEPIACGVREWEEDDGRPILEIARQEGIVIAA